MGKLMKFNNIIFSFILYILVIVVARILFICFFSNLYFIKEKASKIFDESKWSSSNILAFKHTMFCMYSWDGICFPHWLPLSTLPSGHMMKISGLYRHTIFFIYSVMTSNCAGAPWYHLFIISYSSTRKVSADLFEIVGISCCICLSSTLLKHH